MNLPNGYYLQGKKYRLTHTIGQGGFGITYLGVWNTEVKGGLGAMKTTVPVCIKEYFFKDYCYRDKNSNAVKVHSITGEKLFSKFKEKLIEEANILSAVHHPFIVNVLEVFEENDTAYIVMEYINGNTLKYILDNEGIISEKKMIKYTHQIGSALTYVHDKNIVHLDIKPGNILIDQNDNARLIDFGVSKRYDIAEQETSTTTLTLSKGFAAIEQYDNEGMINFSPAPDIYSLGATMYNLLTGVVPVESILRATKQLPPPTTFNPAISQKTEKAILKAMEIKAEDRFRTVNQLLAVIDAPTYDFKENTPVETPPAVEDDHTEIINGRRSTLSEDEDDRTMINAAEDMETDRKLRRKMRRMTVLTVSILMCIIFGYALYSYYFGDLDFKYTFTKITMPGGDPTPPKTDTTFVNQIDSIEKNELVQPESDIDTSGQSEPTNTLQTQTNNTQTQPTTGNNGLNSTNQGGNGATVNNAGTNGAANNNSGNNGPNNNNQVNPSGQRDAETSTSQLTPAQKTSLENEYNAFIMDGKTKMSTGSFSGALTDFSSALEHAKKLDKDLSEATRLINECRDRKKKQDLESLKDKYENSVLWGKYQVVRDINTKKYGVIDPSTGVEIIKCIYRSTGRTANESRKFTRDDGTVDIYDKDGVLVESGHEPPNL